MVLDTNAVIAHLMWFVSKRGGRFSAAIRRRNMEGVARAVDDAAESDDLAIPHTAAEEVRNNLKYAFESAAHSAGVPPDMVDSAMPDAWLELERLRAPFEIADDGRHKEDIGRMFAEIWQDPR